MIYIICANRKHSASKNADFPQIVSAMRLSSGECVKCVQNIINSEYGECKWKLVKSQFSQLVSGFRPWPFSREFIFI